MAGGEVADLIRELVGEVADGMTESLQGAATIAYWTGQDGDRKASYATAVPLPAICEQKMRALRTKQGDTIVVGATVIIPRPLTAQGATGRKEPIDPRDRITLPNGYTAPIVTTDGLIDSGTGLPYFLVVGLQ
jgi:hypothetical protein